MRHLPVDTSKMRAQRIDKIHTIVLHHSASGRSIRASRIQKWHRGRNFADIGYHYVIEGDGKIVLCRPIDRVPAAQKGKNTGTITICIVGDNTRKGRNVNQGWLDVQIDSAALLLKSLRVVVPLAAVVGHRDVNPTLCPGRDIHDILRKAKT